MPPPPRAAIPSSGRLAAVLRSTMWVASGLALVRCALDPGVRGLMSAATVGFYVTAWLTVEQPEHKAWLSGARR